MLDRMKLEDFHACLGQAFTVRLEDGQTIGMVLKEANPLGTFNPAVQKRQAFSLIFRGPPQPVLPQMIYPMANDSLGPLDLFIVPVGPDAQGLCYDAVFT